MNRQCLAKSPASFAVHSPFGFCFISWHHSVLPTSAEQATNWINKTQSNRIFFTCFSNRPYRLNRRPNVVEDQFGALLRMGLQQQVRRIDIDPVNVRQVGLQH